MKNKSFDCVVMKDVAQQKVREKIGPLSTEAKVRHYSQATAQLKKRQIELRQRQTDASKAA
jgi:hypothetical protein